MLHLDNETQVNSKTTPAKRKAYSPQMLPDFFYSEKFHIFSNKLAIVQNLFQQKRIRDVEFVCLVLFYFNWITHQNKSIGGTRTLLETHDFNQNLTLDDVCSLLQIPLRWETEKNKPFFQFFVQRTHRQIPESALVSIEKWATKKYSLLLLPYTPSVYEVVQMQSQGYRCVSVLCDKENLYNKNHSGRDVFSFIIHDLIHADHFFHHDENAMAQIQFAKKMFILFNNEFIKNAFSLDPQFQLEFNYLVSDMNTVPLHLMKSLKAIILRYYKRLYQVQLNNYLPNAIETEFQKTFLQIIEKWNFSEAALQAAYKLNTPEFDPIVDGSTLSQSLQIG